MKIVLCMPSFVAEKATPCAWLPADAATTPFALSSGDKLANLLYAPLTLKAPVVCIFSNFMKMLAPDI